MSMNNAWPEDCIKYLLEEDYIMLVNGKYKKVLPSCLLYSFTFLCDRF